MRGREARRGVSLVEVLLCFALLAAALVPFLGSLGGQAKGAESMRQRVLAESLLDSTFRSLESMPWNDLLSLEDDGHQPGARWSALHLPPVPPTHALRVFFDPVASLPPEGFRKVTLEVRWEVAGKLPELPLDGSRLADGPQVKVRSKLLTNRMQTLQDDGRVRPPGGAP